MTADSSNSKKWTSSWQSGMTTAFTGMFKDNYDGEIRDYWQSQLSGTSGHIIDLACGNGALTWIIDEIVGQPDRATKITGVDIADISPFKSLGKNTQSHPNVSFVGNTSIEQLPFDDNSVDIAVSQFGIEYANLARVIPELSRVIKPGGKMSFILHSRYSIVVAAATPTIKASREVLNDDRLFSHYLELDEVFNTEKKPDTAEEGRVRAALASQLYSLKKSAGDIPDGGGQSVLKTLAALESLFAPNLARKSKKRKKQIAAIKTSLAESCESLEDLYSCSLSDDAADQLVELVEAEGFHISQRQFLQYRHASNFGLCLSAEHRP